MIECGGKDGNNMSNLPGNINSILSARFSDSHDPIDGVRKDAQITNEILAKQLQLAETEAKSAKKAAIFAGIVSVLSDSHHNRNNHPVCTLTVLVLALPCAMNKRTSSD